MPSGLDVNGSWTTNNYEMIKEGTTSKWGMMYRSGALFNGTVNALADKLADLLENAKEFDNPVVLAEISALNGHYNSARQAQSNIMKSVKDTSQAIIRNI